MQQIINELVAKELQNKFNEQTNWTELFKILKAHKKDKKYFEPLANYELFKWNSTHFDADDGYDGRRRSGSR